MGLLLKDIAVSIADPVSTLTNKSLECAYVPEWLKIAKMIPIYNSKDKYLFTNDRPISLLPALPKVLQKVMYKRVYSYLNRNNVLYKHQYGFRKQRCTTDAVTQFVKDTLLTMEQKEHTIRVFLDLSKAFDTTDQKKKKKKNMLRKLQHYGIQGHALKWFSSYLSNRKQYIQYHGVSSDKLKILCGIPQGSILGLLLFLLYINDLLNSLRTLKLINICCLMTHPPMHLRKI